MKPVTEKVLCRFGYERLLFLSGLRSRRLRLSLPEIMEAGEEEPRIFIALPAVLLHNPKIIHRLERDLPRYPNLRGVRELLDKNEGTFLDMEVRKCAQAADTYRRYLQVKKEGQKSLAMNLRLSPQDGETLRALSRDLGVNNVSETIRILLREKAVQLHVGQF